MYKKQAKKTNKNKQRKGSTEHMGETRIHTTHPRANRNVAMPNRTMWKANQQPGQPSQTPS